MCDKAVRKNRFSLQFVPDWFVTQQQLKLRHYYDDYCNDDKLIKRYNGYKKGKAQKASIKEELLPVTWHPSPWWDWCVPEDEKKIETEKKLRQKNCGHKYGLFLCLVIRCKKFLKGYFQSIKFDPCLGPRI